MLQWVKDLLLPQLAHVAAGALIPSLAWELSYVTGVANKEGEKEEEREGAHSSFYVPEPKKSHDPLLPPPAPRRALVTLNRLVRGTFICSVNHSFFSLS